MFDRTDEHFLNFRVFVEEKLESLIDAEVEQGVPLAEAIVIAENQFFDSLTHSGRTLPEFEDGVLPAVHRCSLAEFESRFGEGSDQRQQLIDKFANLYALARTAAASRILVGGSFIDDVRDPGDVDIVILIDRRTLQSQSGTELWDVYQSNEIAEQGIDLKLEADEAGWWGWYRILGKRRPPYPGYRGLVEVLL